MDDIVTDTATDDEVREVAATARPLSLALLWWGPERDQPGADEIEGAHQRRMVTLRREGAIAVLCPVPEGDLAGMAVMTLPPDEARTVMGDDPCVQAGMMRCDVYACAGFPGDGVPPAAD